MATTNLDPTGLAIAVSGAASSAAPGGRPAAPLGLDEFSRRAGPDVAYGSSRGLVRVHAIFAVDHETHEVRISVVDDAGRLIRMIPPETVGEMMRAMSAYGR